MICTLTPGPLSGTVRVPSSKSHVHRLLLCASLSDGPTEIFCLRPGADAEATAACLRALGTEIERTPDGYLVTPHPFADGAELDCGESGSTLRFLLPVLCAANVRADLLLRGRLPERPLEPLWSVLLSHGAKLSRPAPDRIRTGPGLRGAEFSIAADVSSQFLSGLAFALPLLGGGRVTMQGAVQSEPYLALTLDALAQFGLSVTRENAAFTVSGACHTPGTVTAESDWSSAAVWLTAAALGGTEIRCTGLNPSSRQADRAVSPLLRRISAGNARMDLGNIPDLAPLLAVFAALNPGVTRLENAARLRFKESDRLSGTAELIRALGGEVREESDALEIVGKPYLRGGSADCRNDHRLLMAAAAASVRCETPVILSHAEAVGKSYPGFWADFAALGGRLQKEEEP